MTSTPTAAGNPSGPNPSQDGPGGISEEQAGGGQRPAIELLIGLAAVAVPTILSAILVLHDLGSRSLWVDEGATVGYSSQHGAAALWHAITSDGGNMLAYYTGMHVVIRLFGSSPEVLRLPSAIAVILTVPVCFALVRRLFDRRAATFSAFFAASSLPLVYWGQQARAYAVAVLLVTASTLAFVVALQTRRRAAWACYCLVSALAIWTILLAALVIAAQCVALAARRRADLPLKQIGVSAPSVVILSVPVALIALAHGSTQLGWLPPTGPRSTPPIATSSSSSPLRRRAAFPSRVRQSSLRS
jgi:mannosyltransferase